MIQYVDGLACETKAFHDLSWLKGYGRVFCVFDHLISGNLCFGVRGPKGKLFIKYAGTPALCFAGEPEAAVQTLMDASDTYFLLEHPSLTRALSCFRTAEGFGIVFEWFEGFALAPVALHLQTARNLRPVIKYRLIDGLFDLIVRASARDFVAGGIADQHILVDFERGLACFCSVDHFMKMPCVNSRGRLPGSPWYLAPEAYRLGETLDETTSVYAMGALALTFFGERANPDLSGWQSSHRLFRAVTRAMDPDRKKRFPAAEAFQTAWREGVLNLPLE